MASTNRHWPSMFKSKPTAHQDHQWLQSHGSNHVLTSASHRSSSNYTSGGEERTPEPKARWNPKPEQIRILESIFNSGMVNPPRDEIKRIRSRLQEYGQLGDANVFYWFQNRKSRSKNQTRHLQKSRSRRPQPVCAAATTSSPSSSDKSSSKSTEFILNSPTVSINQHHGELFQEPLFFPMIDHENHRSNGMLFTDLMMNHQHGISNKNAKNKGIEEETIINTFVSHRTQPPPPAVPTPVIPPAPTSTITPSTTNDVEGGEFEAAAGMGKVMIVFINDMPFEVAVGPFNVKEAFGRDAVLIDSCGQSVVTNEWGITTHSLQHGAFYYLVRSFTYI